MVAARGRYIAIVSTTVETSSPLNEVAPGISLLGKVLERLLMNHYFYKYIAYFFFIDSTMSARYTSQSRTDYLIDALFQNHTMLLGIQVFNY